MIEFGPGVAKPVAEAARASLDEQVKKLKDEGKLDAGKSTVVKLDWTTETAKAGEEFKKNLGLTNRTSEDIKWTGPMVYSDVLPQPKTYSSPAEKYGVLGIMALGTLQLPEIGASGSKTIESGTVAYISGSDSVVYRSCGGGRAIFFYISKSDS